MTGSRERTDVVLRQLGASDAPTAADAAILQHVVAIVGLRAARLVAANTAVLLERLADGDRADQLAAARTTKTTTTTTPKGVDADVTVIAIDGSVYKHHPRLKNWLELHIGRAVPELKVSGGSAQDTVTNCAFSLAFFHIGRQFHRPQFELMLAEDGSGKGAGLAAAIAARLRQRS